MANNRIFYAVQALGIESPSASGSDSTAIINDVGTGVITWMKGVQSVGITTNFNLEQAFELGQLAIYENIENVPEIEVTAEKVIDGHELLYLTACPSGKDNIVVASNQKAGVYLAIYSDSLTSASGTGASDVAGIVYCSGMRPSTVSYTFPVEGNSTESITLVGNDKVWITGVPTGPSNPVGGTSLASGNYPVFPGINGTPHSPTGTIFRRQHFVQGSSILPNEIKIATGSGRIQSLSASVDLGRENIFELGSFRPYTKFTSFPVATTCDIEVIALSGDRVNAAGSGGNLSDNEIKLYFKNGSRFLQVNLGSKNKLTSVNYTGGDSGGGNASMTFSYQGFNSFVVSTGVNAT
jgi:hypothetical protein